MDQNWIEYQCKSGQTFFLHNKVTGEFKWALQASSKDTENKIMYGCPVECKEVSSIATQTDDNGCNNGCMSKYIYTDSSHVSADTSDVTLPKQHCISSAEDKFGSIHISGDVTERRDTQSSGMTMSDQNNLVENRNYKNGKDHRQQHALRETDRHLNPSQVLRCDTNLTYQNDGCVTDVYGGDIVSSSSAAVVYVCQEGMNADIRDVPSFVEEQDQESCDDVAYIPTITSGGILPKERQYNKKNKQQQHIECPVCKKVLSSGHALNQHLVAHTGEKNFECSHCKKTFAHLSTLRTHLRFHTGEKLLECSYCEKKFTRKDKLKGHIRMHTDERPFECSYCQKAFRRKDHLKEHACIEFRIALNGGECSHCRTKLTTKREISEHMKMHAAELPFECSICKKRFIHKRYLSSHLKTHNREKPFECTICKKMFRKNADLNTHIRIHFNVKPFECSFCEMKFGSKAVLDRHTNIHTGDKPFECTLCEEKFSRKDYLKKHLKSHETSLVENSKKQ